MMSREDIAREFQLVGKSSREQTSPQAQRALWRALKRVVHDRAWSDGHVDWANLEPLIENLLEEQIGGIL